MIPLISPIARSLLLAAGETPAATTTSSTAQAREDAELASWLEMLESYELLIELEMLELMPILEESRD